MHRRQLEIRSLRNAREANRRFLVLSRVASHLSEIRDERQTSRKIATRKAERRSPKISFVRIHKYVSKRFPRSDMNVSLISQFRRDQESHFAKCPFELCF